MAAVEHVVALGGEEKEGHVEVVVVVPRRGDGQEDHVAGQHARVHVVEMHLHGEGVGAQALVPLARARARRPVAAEDLEVQQPPDGEQHVPHVPAAKKA